jgi:hypothetical protein
LGQSRHHLESESGLRAKLGPGQHVDQLVEDGRRYVFACDKPSSFMDSRAWKAQQTAASAIYFRTSRKKLPAKLSENDSF